MTTRRDDTSPQIEEVDPSGETSSQVVYAVTGGGDEFVSGVEGLDVITRTGTPIPADKADELKAAAHANSITVRKVG
jgi:hypothetical protein